MNNNRKYKIIFICVLTIIITLLHCVIIPKSKATYNIEEVDLYIKGRADNLLKRNGSIIGATIVMYHKDGKEYPAYCVQKEKPGVGEIETDHVTVDGVLSNVLIWRAIMNGYPYKTIEQLGCESEAEAFIATKQAIYTLLYGYNIEDYSGIGEAGARTLNALNQIVSNARNSNLTKISSNLNIESENKLWQTDINNQYISKTFQVSANASMHKYTVNIQGEYPEGTMITDIQNNPKTELNEKDKFKVLIPVNMLSNGGQIHLKVTSGVLTKPVFYGKASDPSLQDYALCTDEYEDGFGEIKLEYSKNETKILVLKQDNDEKVPLRGAYFDLYDENMNVIHTNLVSNEEGEIILNDMMPGIYYLKETIAPNQYGLYPDYIKLEINFNEVLTVIVNNQKEQAPKIETIKNTLEVGYQEEVVKLPKTGM